MEISIEKQFGKIRGFSEEDIRHGETITFEQLEWLYEKNHTEQTMSTFVKQIREAIVCWSWNNGTPFGVRQKDYDLHIIQHNELSEYANNQKESHYRSAARYTALLAAVDTTPMTKDQIDMHNKRMIVANAQLESLMKAQEKLGIQAGSLIAFAQLRSDNRPKE